MCCRVRVGNFYWRVARTPWPRSDADGDNALDIEGHLWLHGRIRGWIDEINGLGFDKWTPETHAEVEEIVDDIFSNWAQYHTHAGQAVASTADLIRWTEWLVHNEQPEQ